MVRHVHSRGWIFVRFPGVLHRVRSTYIEEAAKIVIEIDVHDL